MNEQTVVPFFLLVLLFAGMSFAQTATTGRWQLLQETIGISAMHMQLLHNDRVVIFDGVEFGPSNLSFPTARCTRSDDIRGNRFDCTAHSVEYDVATNTFRPLSVQTDMWCSSGGAMRDGALVQTGGFKAGDRTVRIFKPCPRCDWEEIPMGLLTRRWYATNHILPDGSQIIIGGRKQFNYEFFPKPAAFYWQLAKTKSDPKAYSLPFLAQTNDGHTENNLYPFVFLHIDGSLFIFANNRAILFDYSKNKVLKTFPEIPGGDPRNYPSTGSAVILPLNLQAKLIEVEVMVCGGAPKGAHRKARRRVFVEALNTCARIKITNPNPKWVLEIMPLSRVMGDMLLLPNGNVLLINGGSFGTAGWELGRNPVLNPVLYLPNNPPGSRFELNDPSTTPRMYHSTAILLRDGRILVGGSNPHPSYNFSSVLFPTELSLEAFHPSYLDPELAALRPTIITPISQIMLFHGQRFKVGFTVINELDPTKVSVTMLAPPFNTHSFSMNQRLLVLSGGNVTMSVWPDLMYEVDVNVPVYGNIAPSGFYILFVVHQSVPSEGIWVQII
ncbi:aldehyde oxidase GLOX1-like [Benincasa hispida]|uniref:aldehyde oxidase GLOX1-like n=1 Tax=Benincasa hispida TaxID=102211 RepID=UPI001900DFA5|nr:aldehyde oxidase GLOX1-like [Benincasa hispida]